MQIQIFTIPIMGGEKLLEEMNAFLRSKKVLRVAERLVQESEGPHPRSLSAGPGGLPL